MEIFYHEETNEAFNDNFRINEDLGDEEIQKIAINTYFNEILIDETKTIEYVNDPLFDVFFSFSMSSCCSTTK